MAHAEKSKGQSHLNMPSSFFKQNPVVKIHLGKRMREGSTGFYNTQGNLVTQFPHSEYGAIEIEVFANDCPLTSYNFLSLCSAKHVLPACKPQNVLHRSVGEEMLESSLKPQLDYRGSVLHRVIKNFGVQGGDIVTNDGLSQNSVFGDSFRADPEIKDLPHDTEGLVVTASSSPGSLGSQFFILTSPVHDKYAHLGGSCVCFGRVRTGIEILRQLENEVLDFESRPKHIDFYIRDCEVSI